MDPDECWAQINDDTIDAVERAFLCEELCEWVRRGGFLPAGVDEAPFYFRCRLDTIAYELRFA